MCQTTGACLIHLASAGLRHPDAEGPRPAPDPPWASSGTTGCRISAIASGRTGPGFVPALSTSKRVTCSYGQPAQPHAGVAALSLLCSRRYQPIEISNVMYRAIEKPADVDLTPIRVRVAGPEEAQLWTDTSAKGWTHEHPELLEFFLQTTAISPAREQSPCFLAEFDGQPGAAGSLCIHDGVALFAGAATIPEMRRRGLQAALLQERMRYAFDHGCDLAMMVAEAGSDSQRNAERKGFQVAYTRIKWRLSS